MPTLSTFTAPPPRYLDRPDGQRLAYYVAGNGPPVLLIQGVGVHGFGWRPQLEALTKKFQCGWFDHRGIGHSGSDLHGVPHSLYEQHSTSPPPRPFTLETLAADAQAVAEALGWEAAHVTGHSMGVLIAQALALNSKTEKSFTVKSLSLLCTFSRGSDATKLTPGMLWTGMRTRIGTARMRRHAFLELVLAPSELHGKSPAELDQLAQELAPLFGHDLATQPDIVMKQLNAMSRFDATPRLKELAGIPTLVVSAKFDRIAKPEFGRNLAAGIPGAKFVERPDSAHGGLLREPEASAINQILIEHLERVAGSE